MRVLSIPFRISKGAIGTSTNYDDVVRWQVLDAAATNLGERVMRPEWGINARDYLYRPADALERGDTAAVVKQRLKTFVPRATIANVFVENTDLDQNVVTIEVRYKTSSFVGATENTVSLTTTIDGG